VVLANQHLEVTREYRVEVRSGAQKLLKVQLSR